MKTLIATVITSALILPGMANAGHCTSKAYQKQKGYSHGTYHPYAYRYGHHKHGKPMKKKYHYGYRSHGKPMMKKYHHGHGYQAKSPYNYGANMYLHLPKENASKPSQPYPAEASAETPQDAAENIQLVDLLATAAGAGQFNTLVEAVKAAGLETTLTGPGPFTVFAPTDEAFSRLPESILKALTDDTQALNDLLTAHVVPGKVSAADVVGMNSAKSVQGSNLAITSGDSVEINGAKVISTDIEASNGIIHVIDSVIFPQS